MNELLVQIVMGVLIGVPAGMAGAWLGGKLARWFYG